MALIKCPECGKEISNKSNHCVHCGCPIKNTLNENTSSKFETAKNNFPILNKFKKYKKVLLVIWAIITAVCLFFCIVGFALELRKATRGIPIIGIIGIFLTAICLAILICSIFVVHIDERTIDGYSIVVYAGHFSHILAINGLIVVKKSSRHLYGDLPNGKHIHVEFSVWDNAPKIEIESEKK